MAKQRKTRMPTRCGACGARTHIVTACTDPIRRALYRARQLEDWMIAMDHRKVVIGGWIVREMTEVREQLERAIEQQPRAPLDRMVAP